MILVHIMPQRSPEWFTIRLGKLTGSVADDMLSIGAKGIETAGRRALRVNLAAERLGGKGQPAGFVNADMQRGIDLEAEARRAYQESPIGTLVDEVGFMENTEYPHMGCSVDGVSLDGKLIIEIKCPRPENHWETMQHGVPQKYVPQITHNLMISGAHVCDFVSYCPMMPPGLELVILPVSRESLDMHGYATKAQAFMQEVNAVVALMELEVEKRRGTRSE